jgi:DinB superfamily
MKKRMERLILLSAIAWTPLCAGDARMTADERTKVLNWLEESRKEFLTAIDGVTEQQWKWKPAPDRWSVGEVAEHIVLAEASLFGNLKKALSSPANPDWEEKTKGKTAKLEAILAPRVGKATAPEALVPKEGMTPAQAKERFEKQRVEIVRFATETEVPLKQYTVENPFFGTLSGYDRLIYAPLHTMRHIKQIAEVKGTAGYPR